MSSFDRTVVKSSILLGSTIGLIGFSYGIAATSAGIPIALTCATSLLVFAGGSQFVALGVLAGGGSGVAAVASGLLLNARFVAFGVAVAPKLGGGAVRRAVAAHFLVDASAAMALGQSNRARAERAFWWSGLMIFAAWNLGTLLGAAGASVLGDPRVLGLDAAFPAAMLAMLEPHLRTPCGRQVLVQETCLPCSYVSKTIKSIITVLKRLPG